MVRIGEDPAPAEGPWLLAHSPDTAAPPDAALVPGAATAACPPDIFARRVHDYARRRGGMPITVLEAGCGRFAGSAGAGGLRAAGFDVRVTGVDHDHPVTRHVCAARRDLDTVTLGDLRTVPLSPRSFDIVHCAGLLERIRHVELVLDRMVAALKPGGLLLLRTADRESAAGVVDRFMAAIPGRVRERAWRHLHPGEPGPYPAVYEPVVCGPGIQGYALMRGLVIAHRLAIVSAVTQPGSAGRALSRARRFAARASRGRYPGEHDELLFVMHKPEDRFARVL